MLSPNKYKIETDVQNRFKQPIEPVVQVHGDPDEGDHEEDHDQVQPEQLGALEPADHLDVADPDLDASTGADLQNYAKSSRI